MFLFLLFIKQFFPAAGKDFYAPHGAPNFFLYTSKGYNLARIWWTGEGK